MGSTCRRGDPKYKLQRLLATLDSNATVTSDQASL